MTTITSSKFDAKPPAERRQQYVEDRPADLTAARREQLLQELADKHLGWQS